MVIIAMAYLTFLGATAGSPTEIEKETQPQFERGKQIVAETESERNLVDANKKLIEIFEKKIKDKIGEVWGE